MKKLHPLKELSLLRLRMFYREPEAVFWTYGFPIILTVVLGLGTRERPDPVYDVDVVASVHADGIVSVLEAAEAGIEVEVHDDAECRRRLVLGHAAVTVDVDPTTRGYVYRYDTMRPEAVLARDRVDAVLQRAAGRSDPIVVQDVVVTEPGSRYIDFLVPGLLGMNLMGGGLWGIGFVTVDMRVRKLLKRLVATPMRRSDFLLSLIGGRMIFTLPEMVIILLAGVLLFGIPVRGSIATLLVLVVAGALCFAGIGLLVACRADKIETVSGLLNLVMVPMWLLSGIFFSTEKFPEVAQPFIQALPLTQLNNALRAVVLEGAGLASLWLPLLAMALWGGISFALAFRWFRWN